MNNSSKKQLPLHKHVATGGSVKSFKGSQGVNSKTVPNIKSKKK